MIKAELIENIVKQVLDRLDHTPLVPVGISNRHIHLSFEDLEALFGTGYSLTKMKDLLQPGEYASKETLKISGAKGSIDKVRVLGPIRKNSQVELSLTDGLKLGVSAPIKESGDLANSESITIENPLTGAKIERKCAITALRHIHMPPSYAERFGLKDRQKVSVEFAGERSLIFHEVLLRVSPDYCLEMHLDTDEANAGNIRNGSIGRILL